MQNKILKKAIEIYILLATSLIPSVLIAQSLCPPDTGTNCGPWQFSNYQTSTDNPDCNLSVFLSL